MEWRLRRKGWAVGVALVSVGSGVVATAWENHRDRTELERRTLELASTLRTGLATPVESLFAIQSFLQVPRVNGLSLAQFRDFAAPAVVRHPEIAGLEWFPFVSAERRSEFERRVAADQPGFRIAEPTRSGNMVPAIERPLHIPLTLMEPVVPDVTGLDLAFDPLRVAPVDRALESGRATLSDPFQLVEDPPDVMSVAAYAPVTASTWIAAASPGPRYERGVAVALFRLNPLIREVVDDEHVQGIVYEIWDPAAAREAQLIHRSGHASSFDRTHSADIPFVDRTYRLVVGTTGPRVGWVAGLVFALTAIAGALAIAYVDARRRARRLLRKAERLGQYQVEERIASGAMGTVYRARHALLRRPTAIKIAKEDQVAANLEMEVMLTSELTHPNTIMVYDFGRGDDGSFYYAMEYIDGYDLEELVQRFGQLPAARAIRLLLQAAGSLAEAHDKGLVHRDVKPSNLMVTERGGVRDFVKVLDFGLARPQSTPDPKAAPASPASAAFAGTPGYVAPEVIAGQPATPASDIFSLGAVGYHLVVGRGPFSAAATVTEALTLALTTTPVLPASIPVSFAKLITDCLARDPNARPKSMQALTGRLKSVLADCGAWTASDAERWWRDHPPRRDKPHEPSRQTFVLEKRGLSSSSNRTNS
jgi:serine/threonine-protein kinase